MSSLADRAHRALADNVTDDPESLATTHTASAAHGLAARGDAVLFDEAMGRAQLLPEVRALEEEPIFDLASVTKPLVPVTLAMRAVSAGMLSLDTRLRDVLDVWDNDATLLELLCHASGLPAWYKYYEEYPLELEQSAWRRQREAVLARVIATPKQPPGTCYAYSDLGYMALMVVLERVFAESLDVLAKRFIFEPLSMGSTRYVNLLDGEAPIARAVTTECCAVRGPVTGYVHDENTQVLGGVSGHAGVFGTAHDLLKFGRALLAIDRGDEASSSALGIDREVLHAFWSRDTMRAGGHHLAGWDTPSGAKSSAGRGFPRETTVGHLGFTGTSIWMDRASETIAILLTNRVHPTRENPRIFGMRVAFHEAILPA